MRAHTITTQARAGARGRMKRRIVPGGILALSLAVVLLAATAVSPAEGASPGGLYVALGDSVADLDTTYVDRLFPHYQSTLGVTQLSNRAQSGEDSGSIRTGGQLASALADINAASDTRAVTIDIGGNDRECADRWASCPFRYNLFATLSDLKAALDSDPGTESFAAMAYYNPASGLGGEGQYSEPYYDRGLLGTDLVIDCNITAGPRVGINDVIYQEAGRRGAWVADPYLAFKAGGQSFMADDVHPNDVGHAAIAAAFRDASPVCPEAGNLPLPSDSVPPVLQLSGKNAGVQDRRPKQELGNAVKVSASCDETCTARAEGKLTKVKKDKLKPASADLAPGETRNLALALTPKTRKQVRKALHDGKNVQAKITVKATDAAGNVATAKRTVKLVK
jgi:lysophospholipase L1-like esterase